VRDAVLRLAAVQNGAAAPSTREGPGEGLPDRHLAIPLRLLPVLLEVLKMAKRMEPGSLAVAELLDRTLPWEGHG
jgi:hypothetical protein